MRLLLLMRLWLPLLWRWLLALRLQRRLRLAARGRVPRLLLLQSAQRPLGAPALLLVIRLPPVQRTTRSRRAVLLRRLLAL